MTPVYVPWAIKPRQSAFCGYCHLNIWPSKGHRCVVVLLPGHGMYAHETCALEAKSTENPAVCDNDPERETDV